MEGISKTDLPVVVPVTLDHDSIFLLFFSSFFVCLSYNKNDLELHEALLHTFHSFTYSGVCTVNRKQLGASGKDMFRLIRPGQVANRVSVIVAISLLFCPVYASTLQAEFPKTEF